MRSRFVSAVSVVVLLLTVATTAQACPPGGYVVRSGGSYYVWYPPPSYSYAPVRYAYVYTPSGEVTRAYYYSPGQPEAGGTVSQTAYYFAPGATILAPAAEVPAAPRVLPLSAMGNQNFPVMSP